jgi:transcriptional regulator with XRE-family HTH domain
MAHNPHDDKIAENHGRATDAPRRVASLEAAIGREVRQFRRKLDMTVTELAKQSELSPGMLSKVENGHTSPSLATLQAISRALNVPVTALFRKFEQERAATYVKSGEGLRIERRGTRSGHQYQLLGHSFGGSTMMEPYVVTLTEASEVFPLFQHSGIELIFMLDGEIEYRHGGGVYRLEPGDSLFFDADAPHGPENLIRMPVRFLSVIAYAPSGD